LGRARAHRDAEPDAGDVGLRSGYELGRGGVVLVQLARRDGEVERLAAHGELDQLRRGAELEGDLVARGALELRGELARPAGDAAARQRLEFGSLRGDDG